MGEPLQWAFLGRVPYERALELQLALRTAVRGGTRPATLLLLEHEPVITLGRSADAADVLLPEDELRRRGVPCVRIGRGGQVTYHGPGQLVGYPIRAVRRAVRDHICAIVEALIDYLSMLGIAARWDEQSPGVWTAAGKVGAVGVDARGGVTTHGFALNVAPMLEDYAMIVPCGSRRPVTSIEALTGQRIALADAAREIAGRLAVRFGLEPRPIERRAFDGLLAPTAAAPLGARQEVGGGR